MQGKRRGRPPSGTSDESANLARPELGRGEKLGSADILGTGGAGAPAGSRDAVQARHVDRAGADELIGGMSARPAS